MTSPINDSPLGEETTGRVRPIRKSKLIFYFRPGFLPRVDMASHFRRRGGCLAESDCRYVAREGGCSGLR